MGRRRVRTLHTTGAIIGATAIALVGSPAAADPSPSLRVVPQLSGLTPPLPLGVHTPAVGAPAASVTHIRAIPTSRTPITHTVRSGDTVWALAKQYNVTVSAIIQANSLGSNALIRVGQKLVIPGTSSSTPSRSTTTPKPAPAPATATTYKVRAGDTLSAIASKHKTTTAALVKLNNITNPNFIRVGQVLKVSGTAASPAPKPPASVSAPTAPAPKPSPSKPSTSSITYTVKSGDSVWTIARAYKVTTAAIIQANGLGSNALIRVGQRLVIPNGTTPAPPATTTTPKEPVENACKDLVPSTFLHYTYPEEVVAAANENKCLLNAMAVPSREAMQAMVRDTAIAMGVDPALALAIAYQESRFNHRAVSPANAIGTMQVIPSSGSWAGQLLGRKINLLDPKDNVAAGIAIIRSLLRTFPDDLELAIGSYYQGSGSVTRYGLAADTRTYVDAVLGHMERFS